jgi:hypothetical protein
VIEKVKHIRKLCFISTLPEFSLDVFADFVSGKLSQTLQMIICFQYTAPVWLQEILKKYKIASKSIKSRTVGEADWPLSVVY